MPNRIPLKLLVLIGTAVAALVAVIVFMPEIEDLTSKPKPNDALKSMLVSPQAFEGQGVTVEGIESQNKDKIILWMNRSALRRKRFDCAVLLEADSGSTEVLKMQGLFGKAVKITGVFSTVLKDDSHLLPARVHVSTIEPLK